MPEPILSVQNLVKRYGEATVVSDLSFAIAPGECLGVIGPNGAGKTTTIRMCLGLTAPDEGTVTAFGLPMPREALAIKAQLGVVSQLDTLDPDFDCAENLLVYGRYFGLKDAQIRERIPALLAFASLTSKAHAKPGELSGGMKRRLSLARALVNNPRLLLLDEPMAGVNPALKQSLLDHIRGRIAAFQEETGHMYNLEATPAEGTTYRFAREDAKRYPGILQAGKLGIGEGATGQCVAHHAQIHAIVARPHPQSS